MTYFPTTKYFRTLGIGMPANETKQPVLRNAAKIACKIVYRILSVVWSQRSVDGVLGLLVDEDRLSSLPCLIGKTLKPIGVQFSSYLLSHQKLTR